MCYNILYSATIPIIHYGEKPHKGEEPLFNSSCDKNIQATDTNDSNETDVEMVDKNTPNDGDDNADDNGDDDDEDYDWDDDGENVGRRLKRSERVALAKQKEQQKKQKKQKKKNKKDKSNPPQSYKPTIPPEITDFVFNENFQMGRTDEPIKTILRYKQANQKLNSRWDNNTDLWNLINPTIANTTDYSAYNNPFNSSSSSSEEEKGT